MIRSRGDRALRDRPSDVGDDPHHQVAASSSERRRDRRVDERSLPTCTSCPTERVIVMLRTERGSPGRKSLPVTSDREAVRAPPRHTGGRSPRRSSRSRRPSRLRARPSPSPPAARRSRSAAGRRRRADRRRGRPADRGPDRVEKSVHEQREITGSATPSAASPRVPDRARRRWSRSCPSREPSTTLSGLSSTPKTQPEHGGGEHAESPRRAGRAPPAPPPPGSPRAWISAGPDVRSRGRCRWPVLTTTALAQADERE